MQTIDPFYRNLLDGLADGVYLVDRDRTITFWNKAAERITGYTADEIVGLHCGEEVLNHTDAEGRSLCALDCPLAATTADGAERQTEVYLRHRDGHRLPVRVRATPMLDADGRVIGAVEVFDDSSAQLSSLQRLRELEEMALIDSLTGLGNRRYTEMTVSARLDETKRYGWPFGVLFVDIDRFKRVNDALGHSVGDEVLGMVGRTLQNSLRPFDFLGRWGGEEFVAVVVNVEADQLRPVAERARALVARSRLTRDEGPVEVTVSIGATIARKEDTPETLVSRADRLMYQAKRAGRNLLVFEDH